MRVRTFVAFLMIIQCAQSYLPRVSKIQASPSERESIGYNVRIKLRQNRIPALRFLVTDEILTMVGKVTEFISTD